MIRLGSGHIAALVLLLGCRQTPQRADAPPPVEADATTRGAPIPLPGGDAGIGFDDLRFSARLGMVLAPAGRTGNLDLVDAATGAVVPIGGFSSATAFHGGHGEGTTSVDEGRGLLFAIDRTALLLDVVDPGARAIVSSAKLASSPDYVRWVERTGEIWVTEPDSDRLELFSLPPGGAPAPEHVAFIPVPGGPESLVIDGTRGRAYTHLWKGATVAVDLAQRRVVATWKNGCAGWRGIALDESRGWLFAACADGTVVVLDASHDGAELSRLRVADGVDIIAYDPARSHLYVPGGDSATLAIVGFSTAGALSLLTSIRTVSDTHCVTTDGRGAIFICDPARGQLLRFVDP
jgi:hypothetical protein